MAVVGMGLEGGVLPEDQVVELVHKAVDRADLDGSSFPVANASSSPRILPGVIFS